MFERQTRILGGGRGNGKTFAMLSSIYDYVTREHGVTAAVICMNAQHCNDTMRMYINLVCKNDTFAPRVHKGIVEHGNESKVVFIIQQQEQNLRGMRPGMIAINRPNVIEEFLRPYHAQFPQADILMELDDSQVDVDDWTNLPWGRSVIKDV